MAGVGNAISVNWGHPLLKRVLSWWIALPHNSGGTYLLDLTGKNHALRTGTIIPAWGGPRARPGGKLSLSFDGAHTWCSVSRAPVTAPPFTMACWFNPVNTLETIIMQLTDGAGLGHIMEWFSSKIGAQSAGSGEALTATTGATNVWHHAAAVFSTTSARASYLDGANKGTNASADSGPTVNQVSLGKSFGFSGFLNGYADDFIIWGRALSDVEIKAWYDLSRSGYPGILKRRSSPPNAPAAAAGGPFPWFSDYELTGPHWHGGMGC